MFHGYLLSHYIPWNGQKSVYSARQVIFQTFPNICPLVISVQLKSSEYSLAFMRGTFNSASSVLTGFNNRPNARSLAALYV